MMDQNNEIRRLLDLMSASGRMQTKIISKPQQSQVIDTPFPLPWKGKTKSIYINFDLWQNLSRPQRDLILLRAVSWLIGIKWLEINWYQGLTLVSLGGMTAEFLQGDALGVIIAGGLTAIALNQIWRKNRSQEKEIEADDNAVKIATRRGYDEAEATRALLDGIQLIAEIEGRSGLNFLELLRIQNLKIKAKFLSN
jgi:hypothetical protein